ncbi:MAG TPA: glucokinase [Gemmatimonadales bacterium]|nr:glucokinase [Gemmatimonadales bacterium]
MIVLAGDIGGTNARLALVEVSDDAVRILREGRFPTRDSPGLGSIVLRFCGDAATRPNRACFGVPGPVVGEACEPPHLPWKLDASQLAAEIGIPTVQFINDFSAVGYGVERLGPGDLVTLQEGTPAPRGPIALLGAGTGLGEGCMIWDGERYQVYPSEGGHADFAARDALQWRLVEFLRTVHGRVSYDRVLSGPGLANIYRFLVSLGETPEQPSVRAEMTREDAAAVVTTHALAGTDPLCVQALHLFVSMYGAQAGNLGLTLFATGGVYIAGGIAPRIVDKLKDGTFLAAFRDKGRLSHLAAVLPVHVIVNPAIGVLGAAAAAARPA